MVSGIVAQHLAGKHNRPVAQLDHVAYGTGPFIVHLLRSFPSLPAVRAADSVSRKANVRNVVRFGIPFLFDAFGEVHERQDHRSLSCADESRGVGTLVPDVEFVRLLKDRNFLPELSVVGRNQGIRGVHGTLHCDQATIRQNGKWAERETFELFGFQMDAVTAREFAPFLGVQLSLGNSWSQQQDEGELGKEFRFHGDNARKGFKESSEESAADGRGSQSGT